MIPLVYSTPKLLKERFMCLGKLRFPSEEVAWLVFHRFKTFHYIPLGYFDERPLNVYSCPFCGGFHIGHRSGSKSKHTTFLKRYDLRKNRRPEWS